MLNKQISKMVYSFGSRMIGEKTNEYLKELKKTQFLSKDNIEELQWKKFIKLLKHTYRYNEYYRGKYNEHCVYLDEIKGKKDLTKLPVLTKEELREHAQDMCSRDKGRKYSTAKSSGSTGKSVKFYKDRNSSAYGRAAMYRGHSWYNVDIGEREARLWGVPLNRKDLIKGRIGDLLLNRFRETNFNLNDQVMEKFLKVMQKKKPAYLMGYSSLVYEFARFLEQKKISAEELKLKMVKVTAENLYGWQRELLDRTFNAPIAIEYGAAEVGIIAFKCPYGKMHINAEGVLVEERNCEYDAELKELIITDLNNYYTPIIRYELGDFGKIGFGTCECGINLPILEQVIGRTSDIVYRTDGSRVHSSIFSYVLKELMARGSGIKQYRIVQKDYGKLHIQIVKNKDFQESETALLKSLVKKNLGADTHTIIEYVEEIAREKSGKLRYFVSEISR